MYSSRVGIGYSFGSIGSTKHRTQPGGVRVAPRALGPAAELDSRLRSVGAASSVIAAGPKTRDGTAKYAFGGQYTR